MRPRAWQSEDLDAKPKAWNQVRDTRGSKSEADKSQSQARGLRLEPVASILGGDRAGMEPS